MPAMLEENSGLLVKKGAPTLLRVVLYPRAFASVTKVSRARMPAPTFGALVGKLMQAGETPQLEITDAVPMELNPSGTGMTSWDTLKARVKDRRDGFRMLGWFYADPGTSIFPPRIDVVAMQRALQADTMVLLLTDPATESGGFYTWQDEKFAAVGGFYEVLAEPGSPSLVPWTGEVRGAPDWLHKRPTGPLAAMHRQFSGEGRAEETQAPAQNQAPQGIYVPGRVSREGRNEAPQGEAEPEASTQITGRSAHATIKLEENESEPADARPDEAVENAGTPAATNGGAPQAPARPKSETPGPAGPGEQFTGIPLSVDAATSDEQAPPRVRKALDEALAVISSMNAQTGPPAPAPAPVERPAHEQPPKERENAPSAAFEQVPPFAGTTAPASPPEAASIAPPDVFGQAGQAGQAAEPELMEQVATGRALGMQPSRLSPVDAGPTGGEADETPAAGRRSRATYIFAGLVGVLLVVGLVIVGMMQITGGMETGNGQAPPTATVKSGAASGATQSPTAGLPAVAAATTTPTATNTATPTSTPTATPTQEPPTATASPTAIPPTAVPPTPVPPTPVPPTPLPPTPVPPPTFTRVPAPPPPPPPKPTATPSLPYITYVVQPGDTLYIIAVRFGTTVNALVAYNNLGTTRIFRGQVLRIPRR